MIPGEHPYATYLDVTLRCAESRESFRLVNACRDRWYNQTLCKVNDAVVVSWSHAARSIIGTSTTTMMSSSSFSRGISSSTPQRPVH